MNVFIPLRCCLLCFCLLTPAVGQNPAPPQADKDASPGEAVKNRLKKYEGELTRIRTAMLKEVEDELARIDEAIKTAEKNLADAMNDAAARGKAFRTLADLRGERIRVQVLRMEVDRMVPRPLTVQRAPAPVERRLGIVPSPPGPALLAQLNLDRGKGMVLDRIEPQSPAAVAGLQANDILVQIAGKPAAGDLSGLRKQLEEIKPGTTFEIRVIRQSKPETISNVKMPGVPEPGN